MGDSLVENNRQGTFLNFIIEILLLGIKDAPCLLFSLLLLFVYLFALQFCYY